MIDFIKRKIWVSQLAQTFQTYDNRDIQRHYPIAYTVLDKIINIDECTFKRATDSCRYISSNNEEQTW